MSDAILCLWNMDGIEDNGSKLYIRIFCFSSCFTNEERWMFWTPSTCHALYKLWGLFLCSSVYITNEKLSNGMTIFSFSFCLSFRRKRQQTSRIVICCRLKQMNNISDAETLFWLVVLPSALISTQNYHSSSNKTETISFHFVDVFFIVVWRDAPSVIVTYCTVHSSHIVRIPFKIPHLKQSTQQIHL